ncbi:uncharacterized protein CC84DRAFT_294451 [Paraphaeosphaeria sporulosa]|uniref:Uncharacterized protein n=1 Tax=Paraphaeosphaeria sporulosa TaxID=1460663 RepID=A0A177C0E2_9PLEO|nr:uncharacterized protein CC84DRAFT_294451 [Paraphaeosphaeria sporulosa]OAG00312.1 hypothetical protein CC84DRAFT_294451 [Paraphaeosphaeria sporulosa]
MWIPFDERTSIAVPDALHHETFASLYLGSPAIWKTDVCSIGSLRKWLETDKKFGYVTDEEHRSHDEIVLGGDYTGPLNWRFATMTESTFANIQSQVQSCHGWAERSPALDPDRQAIDEHFIFIFGADDAVSRGSSLRRRLTKVVNPGCYRMLIFRGARRTLGIR